MSYRLANISSICLLLATSLAAQPTESTIPTFGEEIIVLGDLPFIYPVETGRPILIRFGIGEIDIESSDRSEILAELGVTCSAKLSDALWGCRSSNCANSICMAEWRYLGGHLWLSRSASERWTSGPTRKISQYRWGSGI